MVLIPAGEYQMGDHSAPPVGNADELPVHAVYIDAFYMDKFEVTNQQYTDALNWAFAHGGLITVTGGIVHKFGDTIVPYCDTTTSNAFSRITWNGSSFGTVSGKEDHPMVLVTWHGAAAYSNWRSEMDALYLSYDTNTWACDFNVNGYRLPTEAEWEKATRGGQNNPYFKYPWGETISGANANYTGSGDPYPDTTPVGYYNGGQTPPGPDMVNGYGLYDMGGNVWEFCNDWYAPDYYALSPYANPRGPASGVYRIKRSGSWSDSVTTLRCAVRGHFPPPETLSPNYGFRLVRSWISPIPAASEWGLMVMGLLTLTAGTLALRRRIWGPRSEPDA